MIEELAGLVVKYEGSLMFMEVNDGDYVRLERMLKTDSRFDVELGEFMGIPVRSSKWKRGGGISGLDQESNLLFFYNLRGIRSCVVCGKVITEKSVRTCTDPECVKAWNLRKGTRGCDPNRMDQAAVRWVDVLPKAFNEGKSVTVIAKEMGYTRQHVWNAVNKCGLNERAKEVGGHLKPQGECKVCGKPIRTQLRGYCPEHRPHICVKCGDKAAPGHRHCLKCLEGLRVGTCQVCGNEMLLLGGKWCQLCWNRVSHRVRNNVPEERWKTNTEGERELAEIVRIHLGV